MKTLIRFLVGMGALAACAVAPAADWPVLTVAYDGVVGSEEDDLGDLEQSSYRHQVTLKARQRWSADATGALVGTFVRKLYPEGAGGSPYLVAAVEPSVRLGLADGLRCALALAARRTLYDADAEGAADPDSYTRLRAGADFTIGLARGLDLAPRAQATFDLYDDATRTRQSYTFGLGLDAKLGQWALGADWRGVVRTRLGVLSLVEDRMDHSFGVDVTWDPND